MDRLALILCNVWQVNITAEKCHNQSTIMLPQAFYLLYSVSSQALSALDMNDEITWKCLAEMTRSPGTVNPQNFQYIPDSINIRLYIIWINEYNHKHQHSQDIKDH